MAKPPTVIVVDNFLDNPDEVRRVGLSQTFSASDDYFKGKRSHFAHTDIVKAADIEPYFPGKSIIDWDTRHPMNARFQYCTALDPLVYHTDLQQWAGALYLTPGAPLESGTTLYRHKETKARKAPEDPLEVGRVFKASNLYDRSVWEPIDQIGNLYNRLVLWDGQHIHAASSYFGGGLNTSRLFMIFFFDTQESK